MAAHSCVLAWRMPWTEEPGGLRSLGPTESDTTEHSQTYKMSSVCLDCLTFSKHASLASNPPGSKLTSAIPVISGGPSGLQVFFILVFFCVCLF